MTIYGLTSTGFVAKPATVVKQELDAAFKSVFGASLGSEPDGSIPAASSVGQEIGILTDAVATQWDGQQALYAGMDPDQATGAMLDFLSALTGTLRLGAIHSTAKVLCFGTAGTVLLAGRALTVTGTGARFSSLADATLAAPAASWAQSTAYGVYDIVKNGGKTYLCVAGGTSDGVGTGPSGTGKNIADGTATWNYVGPDTQGIAVVAFQADDAGPVQALAGDLATIATPVAGWTSAGNFLDAVVGRLEETDAALRVRRQQELQAEGAGPADSIRGALLQVSGVTACTVFVNDSDTVDGDGVPAHGVEVLVLGGDDDAVALAVWKAVGGGIATGGTTTATVTDSSGTAQTVHYSRPTPVPIHVQATVYYNPAEWPATPDAAVDAAAKSALLTAGLGYAIGTNVRVIPLAAAVERGPSATSNASGTPAPVVPAPAGSPAMPGVVDVALEIKTTGGSFGTSPIPISLRQIASFDSSRITITATPETP